MKIKIPEYLFEKEIHLPELVVKGKLLQEIVNRYNDNFLQENKNKMTNKKILKEEISETSIEQRQQLMTLTVSIEEAAFKLYKFAMTNESIDQSLVSMINKLKVHVGDFTKAVETKYALETDQENEDLIDLEKTDKKPRLESTESEPEKEDKEELNEKVSLKETKKWKKVISISQEFKKLEESYSITGFNSKPTKLAIKKLVESIKEKTKDLKEFVETSDMTQLQEIFEDFETSESVDEFDECYTKLTEWANKNNRLYISVTKK